MVRLKNGVSKLLLPAAAMAGLLLAGVGNAGAAPVIEFTLNGSGPTAITANSGSQNFGAFTITGLSATSTQGPTSSVLDLSFSSLSFSASGQILILEASDTGFTYDPANANLNSAGSASVIEPMFSAGQDTVGTAAGSDGGNVLYNFSSSASPADSPYTSPGATSGGTYTHTFTTAQLANPSINGTGYSLSTSLNISSAASSDSFGSTNSSAFITAPAGPALAVPATGWLSLAGGMAMFGGMAIRRRMKS